MKAMAHLKIDDLLASPEAAELLGIEGADVYELALAGEIDMVRTERGLARFPAASVSAYRQRARR